MRLVYGGGGVGVGWGYEISCVLSMEGDVGAWVLLCGAWVLLFRPKFVYIYDIGYYMYMYTLCSMFSFGYFPGV